MEYARGQRPHWLLANLRQQGFQIFGVAFGSSSHEEGDLQGLLEGMRQSRQMERSECFHTLLHLMRNVVYNAVELQCMGLVEV